MRLLSHGGNTTTAVIKLWASRGWILQLALIDRRLHSSYERSTTGVIDR
jgi:hypothetical protein